MPPAWPCRHTLGWQLSQRSAAIHARSRLSFWRFWKEVLMRSQCGRREDLTFGDGDRPPSRWVAVRAPASLDTGPAADSGSQRWTTWSRREWPTTW